MEPVKGYGKGGVSNHIWFMPELQARPRNWRKNQTEGGSWRFLQTGSQGVGQNFHCWKGGSVKQKACIISRNTVECLAPPSTLSEVRKCRLKQNSFVLFLLTLVLLNFWQRRWDVSSSIIKKLSNIDLIYNHSSTNVRILNGRTAKLCVCLHTAKNMQHDSSQLLQASINAYLNIQSKFSETS